MPLTSDCQTVIDGYLECALWASTDEDGEPLDDVYSVADIADESVARMADEVRDFLDLCAREGVDLDELSPGQTGHDFWLTRNRHGAGFWDRGLGDIGDELTKLAHSFGDSDLYVGDDGAIHVT